MSGAELRAALAATLDRISDLVKLGRPRYDADVLVRLAIQRLWISAGNIAEAYRITVNVSTGVEPWAELYSYRSILAHMLPDEVSDDRVWAETIEAVPRIRAILADPR